MANEIFEHLLPNKSTEISEENLVDFIRTMFLRQEIWYDRNIKKLDRKHWNKEDTILSQYKFCNVYRELDRNSQWLITNVIKNNNTSTIEKLWRIGIFRLFNIIEVFETIGFPDLQDYDPEEFIEQIRVIEEHFPSTNKKAYAINSWLAKGTTQGLACASIIVPSFKKYIGDIFFKGFVGESRIQDFIRELTQCEGIAKFVAHEIFLDCCYIDKYTEDNSFNFTEHSWTNVGSGAAFGLRLVMPSSAPNLKSVHKLLEITKDLLPDDFKYIKWDKTYSKYVEDEFNINITNIEFWLCEYSKWWKIKNKVGKQRDKFNLTK